MRRVLYTHASYILSNMVIMKCSRYCYMDLLHGRWLNRWRKSLTATTQECCEQFWTSPGGNTPQSTSCTATYLPSRNYKVRWIRHAGLCWRSGDELISDVPLWTPSHGRAKAERLAQTYIQQLCGDMGCSSEDLPETMNNREEWRERVRYIHAGGTTRWCWLQMHELLIFLFISSLS